MTLIQGNEDDEIRRNPRSLPGKVRGGGGDLTGDAEMQAENWDELAAEEDGQYDSRIDDVGNAQDALLGGTGDLDRVHRFDQDEGRRTKAANEDSPDGESGES
jgi:uncharacterized protein YjbJ (UPF0337 family)